MEKIRERPIKVYIKINSNNEIIDINSEMFIEDLLNWFKIDEGYGDKFAHAQTQYLKNNLVDENGNYKYKYMYNQIIES